MRRVIWIAVMVGGCRVGFDVPLAADGAVEALDPDAEVPLGVFGAAVLVAELASPAIDDDPSLTGDQLELYFESERNGNADIFVSVRSTTSSPWTPPIDVVELNSASVEYSPDVSTDGLVLLFASDRAGSTGGIELYVSTRGSRTEAWGVPVRVPELSSPSNESSASLSTDGGEVVFASDRGGAGYDFYRATRSSSADPWSSPTRLALSTPSEDKSPCLARSDLELWYGSGGSSMLGGADVYVARRNTSGDPFMAGVAVTEINGPTIDDDPWLSPDRRTLYFASDRTGNFEIFVATR